MIDLCEGKASRRTPTARCTLIVGTANAQDKTIATAGVLPWDMYAGQSLLIAFTINTDAPGATAYVFGARGATGDVKGIAIGVDLNGKPNIYIRDTGTTFGSSSPTNVICDSTDHVVVVMIDGTAKKAYGWVDGIAWSSLTAGQAITATAGTTQSDSKLCWGGAGDFVAASVPTWANSHTLKLRNMHVAVMNSWPANYLTLVAELTRNPQKMLPASLLA